MHARMGLVWIASLALLAPGVACSRTPGSAPATEIVIPPAASSAPLQPAAASVPLPATSSAPPPDVFGVDHSGLALKGPIPLEDGGVAMQRGDVYGALGGGRALIRGDSLVVLLTEGPVSCRAPWPRPPHLYVVFQLAPGPDGSFFAGRVASAHLEYTYTGFAHVWIEPFSPVAGARIRGRIGYSEVGSGHHNGFVVPPSRAAGAFDVELCPSEDGDAGVQVPSGLAPDAPLAWTIDGAPTVARSVLVTVVDDTGDAEPRVSRVSFFAQAGIDCDHFFDAKGPVAQLYPSTQAADLGAPQTAVFEPDRWDSPMTRQRFSAWVRLDPFDLATATTAKGHVVAWAHEQTGSTAKGAPVRAPSVRVAGAFEATVCRVGTKFGKTIY